MRINLSIVTHFARLAHSYQNNEHGLTITLYNPADPDNPDTNHYQVLIDLPTPNNKAEPSVAESTTEHQANLKIQSLQEVALENLYTYLGQEPNFPMQQTLALCAEAEKI